jgi:hypothetical protein
VLGGVIGLELTQAFARFGTAVTVVEGADRVVPIEEPEASALAADALTQDDATLRVGRRAVAVSRGAGTTTVEFTDGSAVSGTELLVAVGRRPSDSPEIARVLAPGGRYFAQHVGPAAVFELIEYVLGPLPEARGRRWANCTNRRSGTRRPVRRTRRSSNRREPQVCSMRRQYGSYACRARPPRAPVAGTPRPSAPP